MHNEYISWKNVRRADKVWHKILPLGPDVDDDLEPGSYTVTVLSVNEFVRLTRVVFIEGGILVLLSAI